MLLFSLKALRFFGVLSTAKLVKVWVSPSPSTPSRLRGLERGCSEQLQTAGYAHRY